ncbi:hypothetical protein D3C80_1518060 [compost metagenome]
MQQSALIPAAIFGRRDNMQVHGRVAMYFAFHAERFGQMHRLQSRCDTANVIDTCSENIAGTRLQPLSTMPMFACRTFWPNNRNIEIVCKPFV